MRQVKVNLSIIFVIGFFLILLFTTKDRQDSQRATAYNYVKAVVLSAEMGGYTDKYGGHGGQNLKVRLTSGPDSGKTIEVFQPLSAAPQAFDAILSAHDRIIVEVYNDNGVKKYYFSDFDRTPYFYVLTVVFAVSLIYFGRLIGLKSLIGIGILFVLLWRWFIVCTLQPAFSVYTLALVFCVAASFLMLIVISGISVKTLAALLGTWGGLVIASCLAYLSIYLMHLTGINTEEAFMLKTNIVPFLDFRGVLFASMLLGSLGAIIDVTISIVSAQSEIYQSFPELSWQELYKRGMNVGKDIMGAMSMTLILAYVGSSLPLLLVIAIDKKLPFERVLNLPIVITELVRALVGSIGLTYAIPFTAFITAMIFHCRPKR